MKKLIIIGAGGVGGFLAFNLRHLENQYTLIGFLDDNKDIVGKSKFSYPILGTLEQIQDYRDCVFLIGIAFPKIKQKIVNKLALLNLEYINYISPNAYISDGVVIGKGVIIYPNSFVDHHCNVGDFVTINTCCSVGHDCKLDNYVTLAPNVALAGYTQCLQCSDIGIGAKTRQNVIIGKNAVVGGQAMVLNDIPNSAVVVGIPAKPIKK